MIAPLLVAALAGLALGSFLNVVIHRLPRGEGIARPGSRCPGCEDADRPCDNVPVLSWLLLRGRCRHCRTPIPARYPLVEALTAGVFVALVVAPRAPTATSGSAWSLRHGPRPDHLHRPRPPHHPQPDHRCRPRRWPRRSIVGLAPPDALPST